MPSEWLIQTAFWIVSLGGHRSLPVACTCKILISWLTFCSLQLRRKSRILIACCRKGSSMQISLRLVISTHNPKRLGTMIVRCGNMQLRHAVKNEIAIAQLKSRCYSSSLLESPSVDVPLGYDDKITRNLKPSWNLVLYTTWGCEYERLATHNSITVESK